VSSAALPGAWAAPAKLNLFLHIVGRRADGYHLLETVFQLLDFGDSLEFEPTSDPAVRRLGQVKGVPEEADLTVRAAELLRQRAGYGGGVRIRIEKRLPLGGGLGGGSSDAATTLVALNRIWRLALSEDELAGLGLELGADVPVFVRGLSAWAEGVGERLTPLELPERWYLVVHPGVAVSTAAIFQDPELTRDCPHSTIADFVAGRGGNVCEPVVRRLYPEVDAALDWLGARAPARLTGTGACVFAAFDGREEAERVLGELPARWRGFVARGCNRSPLYRGTDATSE
jgi:4-diphosphocytidyl-2-C-methyl-D-erythritol kinase